jgi:poly(3-hydroxyalkanoate) synthetase
VHVSSEPPVPGRADDDDGMLAAGLRLATALLARPGEVARRGAGLLGELARIGLGGSRVAPAAGDDRFADPVWSADPLLRMAVQVHLATTGTATALLDDAALDDADDRRVRGLVGAVADVLDPGNNPLLRAWAACSPVTGTARGRDAAAPVTTHPDASRTEAPRTEASRTEAEVPANGDRPGPTGLTVGEDLAATPGAVVLRTEVFELIQYLPQTREVRAVPLLVVPPPTARYYLADLAPGRSVVEHLVRGGQQVLVVSWRNPGPEHAGWDLDTYGQAVLDALAACERIARVEAAALLGFGDGATLCAMVLGHLAAIGQQHRVTAAALDTTPTADPGALPDTPADVRQWAADGVRAPARLRADLAGVALDNLARPGATRLLGTPLDLGVVDRDLYVVAGSDAAALATAYRTARLVGGHSRLVRVSGGQAGALVAPPGVPGAGFTVAADPVPPPAATAEEPGPPPAADGTEPGSWWADLLDWLGARSGELCDAPAELGGRRMPAVAPSPGEYVLAR